MTCFYGDLIVAKLSLQQSLSTSADALLLQLEHLTALAENAGVDAVWSRARPVGTSFSNPIVSGSVAPGVSLNHACIAGIGFLRDHFLYPEIPEHITRSLESERERRLAQLRLPKMVADSELRQPEIKALQEIANAAKKEKTLTIEVVKNIESNWQYQFADAWCRRLAYILAFEASLPQHSLVPYQVFFDVLLGGSLDQLKRSCPSADEPTAFSVYLNLLDYFYAAIAYQRHHQHYPKALGDEAVAMESKEAFLQERLEISAGLRGARLEDDAGKALQLLLEELEYRRRNGFWFTSAPPMWGSLVPDVRRA